MNAYINYILKSFSMKLLPVIGFARILRCKSRQSRFFFYTLNTREPSRIG